MGRKLRPSASVAALLAGMICTTLVLAQPAGPAASPSASPSAPEQRQAQRPNVLVWMLDDVGFAQLSCFGGLIATPNIDRVARMGLRYLNYHTPPICSASRASLLSGRMPHTVHIGAHGGASRSEPGGYDGHIPASAGSIADNLRQAGYRTFALGKWDHLRNEEASPAGPFNQWPAGQGFDHFYGFLFADSDNWNPILIRDTTPVAKPDEPGYHLNRDLADQAMAMIRSRDAGSSLAPFFMYWATGTAHAPHHAPKDWIERYKGKFDMGWDKAREAVLKAQKAQGLVPKSTELAPRPDGMPAWDSLGARERKLYARQMEVFAAALSYADEQFGRILDSLDARGELDNTIVIVTSDNGASAEGSYHGTYNEAAFVMGKFPGVDENMPFYDRWGGLETYPHYSFGWAVVGNTPFRYYKQTTHEGGVHVPLIVAWPKGIAARDGVRGQFVHSADIAPTILEAAGVPLARSVNNVKQQPMEGLSFAYSFAAPKAADRKKAQYFELYGNKGLWSQGWSIVTSHRLDTWVITNNKPINEPWELYDLMRDPGQVHDLAKRYPHRVEEMDRLFAQQAERYLVNPIKNAAGTSDSRQILLSDLRRRGGKYRYSGPVGNIPGIVGPPISTMRFNMRADLDLPDGSVTGPIFAAGGQLGGMALYLRGGKPVFVLNNLGGDTVKLAASDALPAGRNAITLIYGTPQGSNDHQVTIKAGDRVLAEGTLRLAMPMFFGISAVFGVGIDNGSPVLAGARPDVPFPGEISNVVFDFSADAFQPVPK